MRFEESPATPEEDSYDYRLEWDDYIRFEDDFRAGTSKAFHCGPGSSKCDCFDHAWDAFKDMEGEFGYKGVRLIRIDKSGNETIYASAH